ncbi:MAG: NADH:flavin oxidoreductase [Spirochaetota bacterium]
MSDLFKKTNIKSMHLKNRLVRSATYERMFNKEGHPLPELGNLYIKLAKGGVGLIITGYAIVSSDNIIPYSARIDEDYFIPEFREITNKVHEYDCCIAMQLNHFGRLASKIAIGIEPTAPSAVKIKFPPSIPREMTEEDIERVIIDFAEAASRAKKAGFDAVQLHGAHGMLINQFLSPYTNRREDRWGGSLENRIRFLREIYLGCRKKLGDNFPILVKLSAYDNMKTGLKLEEGIKIAESISELGFDGIEISCGILLEDGLSTLRGNFPVDILIDDFHSFDEKPVLRFLMRHFGKKLMKVPDFTIGYNRKAARLIKQKVKIPVFTVGGMHDPKDIMDVIEKGEADYISLCRPLIADPAFPLKIKEGNLSPSKCLQCNYCFFYTVMKAPLKCYNGRRINSDI